MGNLLSCIARPNDDDIDASSGAATQRQASEILSIIVSSESVDQIHKSVHEIIRTTGWTEELAKALLNGLVSAIEAGASMAKAATSALETATDAAFEFAKEHPVYTTILAIGVLVILTPWVIEALGFSELGPIEGSFAAWWQSRYAGYVPKGSLFAFFQRLGMIWH
ncbi:hypothetical protein FE257_000028 [Aspergillus nanangensis]|uniref:Uncharacterized protein n=1 Tax=Aspergillus nanangensis TaxID=2582783 RepID=A0AAD4CYL8_ASPNN|nr:hypothetical protein FE257_000028 [Aspergillus nanangensis]